MDGIFRLRDRVFHQRLKWRVLSRNGLERDSFDDLNPIYFASSNPDGTVDGTWRLLPTSGSTMLRDVFPFLLEGRAMPNSPMIWELSRLALEHERPPQAANDCCDRCTMPVLLSALMEFCSQLSIRELVVVHDVRMARVTSRTLGYGPTWESRRVDIEGVETSAAQYRIDSPIAFRRRVGLAEPVLKPDEANWIGSVA